LFIVNGLLLVRDAARSVDERGRWFGFGGLWRRKLLFSQHIPAVAVRVLTLVRADDVPGLLVLSRHLQGGLVNSVWFIRGGSSLCRYGAVLVRLSAVVRLTKAVNSSWRGV